jgi:uncharacterized protein DUF4013
MMPLSLAIGLIVPAAEIHMIAKDDFSAGFQVKEWRPIFKRNWGGFVVALAILYALWMALSIIMQLMFISPSARVLLHVFRGRAICCLCSGL